MEVSVDRSLCYGSAECAHRAPAVFVFEDGYGVVGPRSADALGDPGIREAVRAAAEACPSQAIALGQRTWQVSGERDVTRVPESRVPESRAPESRVPD